MPLIKNFKNYGVNVSTLAGQTAHFPAKAELEVPESLVEACVKKGLLPSDEFKAAIAEAQITDSADAVEAEANEAELAETRARNLALAAAEAQEEAEAEALIKRKASAAKAAATKKANAEKKALEEQA